MVFDTGVVKLADFGLSKTLPINKHAEIGYLDSKFRLTGETGEGGVGSCVVDESWGTRKQR